MKHTRTAGLMAVALAAVALGLCGCAGMRLSGEAPPGVDLSGTWKLDTALSTDTHAALASIVPRRRAKKHPQAGGPDEPQTQTQTQPQTGRKAGRHIFDQSQTSQAPGAGNAVMPVDTSLQRSLVSGGDYLEIKQQTGDLVVSNGETTRDYVAGERSVVSIPEGAAERRSGWKGKEFRVELRPDIGPRAIERFRLDDSGKRLIETIEVESDGRIRKLKVTRVYDPTNAVPTLLPADN